MKAFLKLLNSDEVAIIDHEDYERLHNYKWRKDHHGYVRGRINGQQNTLHRIVMNFKIGDPDIDHKNGNKLDNRRSNLRACTQRMNTCNRPKQFNNKTGYKGVAVTPSKKRYRALIQVRGKQIYLGTFPTPEDAAKIYDDAAKLYFGEFAFLNFPPTGDVA